MLGGRGRLWQLETGLSVLGHEASLISGTDLIPRSGPEGRVSKDVP